MKHSIIFSLALLLTSCVTQPPQIVSFPEPVVYVVSDLESSQGQLYLKANQWLIRTFAKKDGVVEYSDREEGVLMGKFTLYDNRAVGVYGSSAGDLIQATIDIRVKDGKARFAVHPLGEWQVYYFKDSMTGRETFGGYSEAMILSLIQALREDLKVSLLKEDIDF